MRRVYLVNVTSSQLVLFAGNLTLAPQGAEGSVYPLDERSAKHADVLALESRKQLRVLTQAQYLRFLKGKPAKKTDDRPEPAPEPEVVTSPVVDEPPAAPEADEPEADEPEADEPEADEEPADAPIEPAVFARLSKQEQLDELTSLGIELTEENSRTMALAEATYTAWYADNS